MASVLRTSLPTSEARSAAGRALRDKVKRAARGPASSAWPPMSSGIRPLVAGGATGNWLPATGWPAKAACSSSRSASKRRPRSANDRPARW